MGFKDSGSVPPVPVVRRVCLCCRFSGSVLHVPRAVSPDSLCEASVLPLFRPRRRLGPGSHHGRTVPDQRSTRRLSREEITGRPMPIPKEEEDFAHLKLRPVEPIPRPTGRRRSSIHEDVLHCWVG